MTAVALVPARLMPQTPRVELLARTAPTSVEAMVVQSAGDSRMTTRMLLRQRQSSKPVKFARTTRASLLLPVRPLSLMFLLLLLLARRVTLPSRQPRPVTCCESIGSANAVVFCRTAASHGSGSRNSSYPNGHQWVAAFLRIARVSACLASSYPVCFVLTRVAAQSLCYAHCSNAFLRPGCAQLTLRATRAHAVLAACMTSH